MTILHTAGSSLAVRVSPVWPTPGWRTTNFWSALRKGKWKILHVGADAGGRADRAWQLYDIVRDPGETHDLSETEPEVLKRMVVMWEEYVKDTGTVWNQAQPVGFGKGWDAGPEDVIGGE